MQCWATQICFDYSCIFIPPLAYRAKVATHILLTLRPFFLCGQVKVLVFNKQGNEAWTSKKAWPSLTTIQFYCWLLARKINSLLESNPMRLLSFSALSAQWHCWFSAWWYLLIFSPMELLVFSSWHCWFSSWWHCWFSAHGIAGF